MSEAHFEAFQVLIFKDQIQDLQGPTQLIDSVVYVVFNLVLQVDQIPILCC